MLYNEIFSLDKMCSPQILGTIPNITSNKISENVSKTHMKLINANIISYGGLGNLITYADLENVRTKLDAITVYIWDWR